MASLKKITPSSPRLASLLSDVERGNIKIPVFQRQYIWTDEQIVSLLDSIYKGYPVGSLLMWTTHEELKHERNVGGFKLPETPEDYPVNYILDGQQRLRGCLKNEFKQMFICTFERTSERNSAWQLIQAV